jgi:hypothetical protein
MFGGSWLSVKVAMKSPPAMPEFRPFVDAPLLRKRILPGLVLFSLVHAGQALAGDQVSIAKAPFDPVVDYFHPWSAPAAAMSAPGYFGAPTLDGQQVFSTTDFRPRKRSLFDRDPAANLFGDAPLLRTTTVWQRLSAYKSHDRVQVLTLWESSGSTVSLQAGKRGDPSLQWTSRVMNHGGSTQGLLDRLFSVSLAGATAGLRNATHSNGAPSTSKPAAAQMAAGLK